MPIIKSAIKKNRQSIKRQARNNMVRSRMKTLVKNILKTSKADPKKAAAFLPDVYSVIDTAIKKNLIHRKNGARKKSKIAKAVTMGKGSSPKKEPVAA